MRPTFLRGAEGRERPPLCLSVGMLSRRMPACPGSHATGPRPLPTQGLPRRSAIRRYDCFKEPVTGNSAIAPAPPHRQSEPSQTDDLAEPRFCFLSASPPCRCGWCSLCRCGLLLAQTNNKSIAQANKKRFLPTIRRTATTSVMLNHSEKVAPDNLQAPLIAWACILRSSRLTYAA